MALLELQSALAGAVSRGPRAERPGFRLSERERGYLERVRPTRGLAFTAEVRRSWCELRATRSAGLTLAALPSETRCSLVAEWLDLGGGASSFFASEAEDFLEFLAQHLQAASHVLSICRFEQAVHRAASAAAVFSPPEAPAPDACLRRGTGASLVEFLADPAEVLWAAQSHASMPPVGDRSSLLFAPGLPDLWRPASASDRCLWDACAAPLRLREWRAARDLDNDVDDLLVIGALELA